MAGLDHRLACEFARAAGEQLVSIQRQGEPGPALGRRGDRASNEFLVSAIRARYPSDAILSEEEVDNRGRLAARRVWIIDPLDGTREFAEQSRDDWSVHVALWEEGDIVAAAVALPARGTVLCTAAPPLARSGRIGNGLTVVVSRTRPPEIASRVASAVGAACVPMGSAGAKTAAVILGYADAYLHDGGQYEWDSAAPVGVARMAGLHASRLSGEPLTYNGDDVSLPDLLVCRRELAATLLGAIAEQRAR